MAPPFFAEFRALVGRTEPWRVDGGFGKIECWRVKGWRSRGDADLDQGDGEDDDQQRPADGGGETEITGLDALFVEVFDDGQAAESWAGALEEDVGELEELERGDDADQEKEDQHGADAGEGDVAELGEGVGAVDFGGFVEFAIDRLQGGEPVDHGVADGYPEAGEDDGGHREIWRGTPVGFCADHGDGADEAVEQAVAGGEDEIGQDGKKNLAADRSRRRRSGRDCGIAPGGC